MRQKKDLFHCKHQLCFYDTGTFIADRAFSEFPLVYVQFVQFFKCFTSLPPPISFCLHNLAPQCPPGIADGFHQKHLKAQKVFWAVQTPEADYMPIVEALLLQVAQDGNVCTFSDWTSFLSFLALQATKMSLRIQNQCNG